MIEHIKAFMKGQESEFVNEDIKSKYIPATEGDPSVSFKGRVITDLMAHLTNDLAIGKKIKSGELRKRLKEPPWKVPDCFNFTHVDMDNFTMKYLASKENPRYDRVILQLHGGGYMGAVRNAYYVFAGLYNEVSHGCSVLTPDYRVAPEHPYPAALEDALASYQWLLDRGWDGEDIVIAGDSAGGGDQGTQGEAAGVHCHQRFCRRRKPLHLPERKGYLRRGKLTGLAGAPAQRKIPGGYPCAGCLPLTFSAWQCPESRNSPVGGGTGCTQTADRRR